MKKFYTLVSATEKNGGFSIELDGKVVRTPAGTTLTAPTRTIADFIVGEWSSQGETIDPETMPVTQILTTCLDHVCRERNAIHPQVMAYLDTDLICYFHDDETQDVYQWQYDAWEPWHKWFKDTYGDELSRTSGLVALKQSDAVRSLINKQVKSYDDLAFTVLQLVTALSGSLVLALAFMKDEITEEQIFKAAFVEELYRAELYNEKLHGHAPHQEKKMKSMQRDLTACRNILRS